MNGDKVQNITYHNFMSKRDLKKVKLLNVSFLSHISFCEAKEVLAIYQNGTKQIIAISPTWTGLDSDGHLWSFRHLPVRLCDFICAFISNVSVFLTPPLRKLQTKLPTDHFIPVQLNSSVILHPDAASSLGKAFFLTAAIHSIYSVSMCMNITHFQNRGIRDTQSCRVL